MLEFKIPFTVFTLLMQPIYSGMLFFALFLFIFFYLMTKSEIYIPIILSCIISFTYVFCEALLLYIGSINLNFELAVQFHRIGQVSVLFYIALLPFILKKTLEINEKWHKFNNIILYAGLIFSLLITIFAFYQPDLFISTTNRYHNFMLKQVDFGRGKIGVLYNLRDVVLLVLAAYSIICIIFDYFFSKENREQILFLGTALFCAILGGILDVLSIHFEYNIEFLPEISFSKFSLGMTLFTYIFIAGRLKTYLKSKKLLAYTSNKLVKSQNRYYSLVEGTDDCIITADNNLIILSANKSALNNLNLKRNSLKKTNVIDLFCFKKSDHAFNQLTKEQINFFLKKGKNLSLKASLFDKHKENTSNYIINFEKIKSDPFSEILIKAFKTNSNVTSQFINYEHIELTMGNDILLVEDVCQNITTNLTKFLNMATLNQIKTGLREMIVNGIEHGNLGISFEEKNNYSRADKYISFIVTKKKLPENKNKKIHINYELFLNKVIYTITDDGDGFDYSKIIHKLQNDKDNNLLSNGRGIFMAKSIFDEVIYNKKGNSVKIIKYFDNKNK